MKMLANQSACNYEMHELVKSKLSIDYRIINRTSGRDVLPLRSIYETFIGSPEETCFLKHQEKGPG